MNISPKLDSHFPLLTAAALITILSTSAAAQVARPSRAFNLFSSTVTDGSTMPISTIDNIVQNNVNVCSIDGAAGGNMSPDLSWTGVPEGTQTFVVVLYDPTAAFTHWGMYNVPASTTGLSPNAGVPNSPFGPQIVNDFGDPNYDGPCPPANVAPTTHDYVFTVYALATSLTLPGTPNFPANAETLYHALIDAARQGLILGSASLTGNYSTTSRGR